MSSFDYNAPAELFLAKTVQLMDVTGKAFRRFRYHRATS